METILAQALADLKSDTETKKDTTQWVVSKFGATKKTHGLEHHVPQAKL